ncbi:MAG TPA: hypothetical protein VK112_00475 [Fodinibius sp.]|nr:hypothetical protein [Fodinibius sp.]
MKSLVQKTVAVIFIAALATGCASMTDAGLSQQQPEKSETEQVAPNQPNDVQMGTDADVSPIVDRPE